MAHQGARRPPTADHQHHHHHQLVQQQAIAGTQRTQHHQANYLRQKDVPVVVSGSPAACATPASSKASAAAVDLVRPHYRGHQRRQSVARLLPDISKLRLLSWLVEASNELINCDIAIMDGVYAKLNRSRESLLFWQQSQREQRAAGAGGGSSSSRAPPPPPPSVQPVANKTVISKRQKHQLLAAESANNNCRDSISQTRHCPATAPAQHHNKFLNQKAREAADKVGPAAAAAAGRRSHHSLPLTDYDSSSLAALSMRSSLSASANRASAANDTDSIRGSICSQSNSVAQSSASDSIAASTMLMMQQNVQHRKQQQQLQQQQARQPFAMRHAGGQPTGARNNCSLPSRLSAEGLHPAAPVAELAATRDYCDDSNQSDDDDDDEDDDNSSAASSTSSSGIHGASSSSSSGSSSSASSASSSLDSSCSFDRLTAGPVLTGVGRATGAGGEQTGTSSASAASANATTTAGSSAEQLSERIRRAVMEHNYLQNLLVNVIRQHDRQRERHEQELLALRQPASLDAYARPGFGGGGFDEMPRIDLASIADALDDGCQCSCHHSRPRFATQSAGAECTPLPTKKASSTTTANNRASTLPTSSSLSLFQPANLVPSRKNRRKKHSEPSREDLIQRLADKLCENCFETHYWLHSCLAIESPVGQAAAATTLANDLNAVSGGGVPVAPSETTHDHHLHRPTSVTGGAGGQLVGSSSPSASSPAKAAALSSELDSIVALRNATFIKLVQQQVRATISNSIELIDLIRREIKSPESIKQKQLMRCFSASIKLLSSVASYVVPTQDISTFISTDMVSAGANIGRINNNKFGHANSGAASVDGQQQAASLFSLPPSDFDHLVLYHHGHQHPAAGLSDSFLANHSHHRVFQAAANQAAHHQQQQQQSNNYHLAQAPEIPIRRRHNPLQPTQQQQQQEQRQRRSLDESCNQGHAQQHPRVHLLSSNERSGSGGSQFRSLPPDVLTDSSTNTDIDNKTGADGNHFERAGSLQSAPILGSISTGIGAVKELTATNANPNGVVDSSSGASSNNSSASSSIARGQVQQSSLKAQTTNPSAILDGKLASHELVSSNFGPIVNDTTQRHHHQQQHGRPGPLTFGNNDLDLFQSGRAKFWQSPKFNFIKKLLQVKQQRLLRQQSKDRRIYNNKVANKFRLVMMDLIHFNKSQQLLATENGVNSLLTSMRNVLEFGLYLTVKLY
jgi:hypothetical protein